MLPGARLSCLVPLPANVLLPFQEKTAQAPNRMGRGSPVAPPAFGLWISRTAPRSAHSRLSPAHCRLHFMKCLGTSCFPQDPLRRETEAIPGSEIKTSMHVPAVCLLQYPWARSASEPRFLGSGCPLGTSHA